MANAGDFSGWFICYECGTVRRFPEMAYDANPKPPCICKQDVQLTPLLDSEVAYYVRKHWEIQRAWRIFRTLVNT